MRLSKDLKVMEVRHTCRHLVNGASITYKGILFKLFSFSEFRVVYLNNEGQKCFMYFTIFPNKIVQESKSLVLATIDDDWTFGMCLDVVISHIKGKGFDFFLGKNSIWVKV